jgi:hypothetical protein
MLQANNVSNTNDYKVVSFHNSTNIRFTPELGCMYDGRVINGKSGFPGIDIGETIVLPYHVAHQLAKNLAKVMMNMNAPIDSKDNPNGTAIWNDEQIESKKLSFLTELYSEEKLAPMSETDKLMAKVEEYKAMVEKLIPTENGKADVSSENYATKADVLAELEKRNIPHDKRKTKDDLLKLLA